MTRKCLCHSTGVTPLTNSRSRWVRTALACSLLVSALFPAHTFAATPAIVPAPAQVAILPGTIRISASTRLVVAADDAAALRVAAQLRRLLQRSDTPVPGIVRSSTPAMPAIHLALATPADVTAPEGYHLRVDRSGVQISAGDEAGLFYGAVSLWQLMTAAAVVDGAVELHGVDIRDWPRLRWRGVMLDSARHFQDVATVKRLIDAMALHKLNTLHWHLTDDQGWRVQILRYPALTGVGAWRTPPCAGTYGEPLRYGGFYTQQQIRELVAYAAARHIQIVPEIDMPGHAQAAAAAYPEHVGDGAAPQVGTRWGVLDYLYGVEDADLDFVRNVLDDVITLFPSPYVHVGGDEAVKYRWQASPRIQARMRALGIADEDQLQSWFIGQVGEYLHAHGKRLIGWDEILLGDLPRDATVMSWHGIDGALQAARMGHDTILAPSPALYFDNLQSARSDEPAGRLKIQSLQQVYAFEPLPATLDPAAAAHVLGAQAQLWSEYLVAPWQIDHALFPRIAALSEAMWSPPSARDWNGFLQRLVPQLRRYRLLGIQPADSAFAVDASHPDPRRQQAGQPAILTLSTQAGFGQIHYTLDGRPPSPQSPLYGAPLRLPWGSRLIAASFASDGTPLSSPRTTTLDLDWLYRRHSSRLLPCRDDGLRLRIPLLPDLAKHDTPVYNVDLFDACWIDPDAALPVPARVQVDMARLARNFSLTRPQLARLTAHPPGASGNQLDVHSDNCKGPVVASMPLPVGDAPGVRFSLEADLPAMQAGANLCLIVVAPLDGPLYAVDAIRVEPVVPPEH